MRRAALAEILKLYYAGMSLRRIERNFGVPREIVVAGIDPNFVPESEQDRACRRRVLLAFWARQLDWESFEDQVPSLWRDLLYSLDHGPEDIGDRDRIRYFAVVVAVKLTEKVFRKKPRGFSPLAIQVYVELLEDLKEEPLSAEEIEAEYVRWETKRTKDVEKN